MNSPDVASLPAYGRVPEPELAFHPERDQDTHVHPLKGLLEFGPYSRSLLGPVLDPIRLAFIVPAGDARRLGGLVEELEGRHAPRERKQYLPEFPGFSRVFGVRAVRSDAAIVELARQLDEDLLNAPQPHLRLAEALVGAVTALQSRRTEFDVVVILLPTRWEPFFTCLEDPDFDLHDHLKAVTASRGVPVQLLREDRALAYFCRCSVMWRLGIALYSKAGGIPWKLAKADSDTAFVGLSYAVKQTASAGPAFITCCSQVFDADGGGLEFVAYETNDAKVFGDNPYLSRAAMHRVMARSLALYQRRHAGRCPRRVTIHKTTPFKPSEVDGAFDAWSASEEIDLLQIQTSAAWRGIKIEAPRNGGLKGQPSSYPCERGVTLPLGARDMLLWTQGDAPSAADGHHFYKEGKGIPEPLLLSRYAGHCPWFDLSRQVLGLTKMDWNNDALYDRRPVTISYASVLAGVVKRMPTLAPMPYQFRFFM